MERSLLFPESFQSPRGWLSLAKLGSVPISMEEEGRMRPCVHGVGGQTLHKAHGLKLGAGQVPQENGVGVGGRGKLCQPKKQTPMPN